jgi:hypothetical protein
LRLYGLVDRCLPRRLVLATAGVGALAAAAVALTTIVPGAPLLPEWVWIPIFVGVFPVHIRTVRVAITIPKRSLRLRQLTGHVSFTGRLVVLATVIGALVLWVSAMRGLPGQPVQSGGRYYLNEHGDYIAVTRAQYLDAVAREERGFTAIAFILYVVALVVNSLTAQQLRSLGAEPGRPPLAGRDAPAQS